MSIQNRDLSINAPSNYGCTGCSACKLVCPVSGCISLDLNIDGFMEAKSNSSLCTNCQECQKVCYKYHDIFYFDLINQSKATYIASNKDRDIHYNSSSGGVGSALVLNAIRSGYKVIGATLNRSRVEHIVLENESEIEKIRGSKYIYSFNYEAFSLIEKYKKFLVIGTPCQIAGLKKSIEGKRGYENLICVDFRCFGCAGYNLFYKYIEHLNSNIDSSGIKKINMRSKDINWHRWGVNIEFNSGKRYFKDKFSDAFAISFRSGQAISYVCQTCTLYQSGTLADLRIEDAWSFVNNQEGENLKYGMSQVGIFTEKGEEFFEHTKESLNLESVEFDYSIPKVRSLSDNSRFLSRLRDIETNLEEINREYLKTHPKEKRTLVWQYLNTLSFYKNYIRYWPKIPKDIFISIAVFIKMDLIWALESIFKRRVNNLPKGDL